MNQVPSKTLAYCITNGKRPPSCIKVAPFNATFGTFDSTKSSTFKNISSGFQASYGDGTIALGSFITETVTVGGVPFKNLTLGFATQGATPADLATEPFVGIVGVSYIAGEAGKQYPTILSQLVTQGVIATQAFSLYLNDIRKKRATHSTGRANSAR
jgi:Eukaryotic aspartyl protease